MANYFSKFPKLYYSFDGHNSSELITSLTTRFSFEESLRNNTSVFYEYDIRDGDTPEILASKVYGSAERHWIILLFNDIVDPFYDWPLQYDTLNEYIDQKYLPRANSNTSGSGIAWSHSNVHSYYRVEKCYSPNGTVTVNKYEVDANTYANTAISLNNTVITPGNISVVFDTTKETKSYYEYEMEQNENKRTIKMLKPDFVSSLEFELENLVE